MSPKKYASTTQPGLFFWTEQEHGGAWIVFAQADGFPAHEAFDDWLANAEDADAIAKELAAGGRV